MVLKTIRKPAALCALATVAALARPTVAATLRVAAYNIEADTSGEGTSTQYGFIATALEDVGSESTYDGSHALDIVGLEETVDNSNTSAISIATDLNTYYGSSIYAAASSGTEEGSDATAKGQLTDGNGPNSLIYNQTTLTLLGSVGVGTPEGSGNGEYRQVMRYEFQPVGGTAAQDFYVYVEHAKSGSGSTSSSGNSAYRAGEATIVANNIASLPSGSSYLVMGDMNIDGTNESVPSGVTSLYQQYINAGMIDPLNASDSTETYGSHSTVSDTLFTESVQGHDEFYYRDDYQFNSANIYNGTSAALDYVAGSEHAFGNNGSVTAGGNYSTVSTSPYASTLVNSSDHLPIVADYTIVPVPEPASLALFAGAVALLSRRRPI